MDRMLPEMAAQCGCFRRFRDARAVRVGGKLPTGALRLLPIRSQL